MTWATRIADDGTSRQMYLIACECLQARLQIQIGIYGELGKDLNIFIPKNPGPQSFFAIFIAEAFVLSTYQ